MDERQFAGLTAYYCRFNFFYVNVTADADGQREVMIFASEASYPEGRLSFPITSEVIPNEGKVKLALTIRGRSLQFYYALAEGGGGFGELKPIGKVHDASLLCDECGGHQAHGSFTGAFVGMACSDIDGQETRAKFDYFKYKPVKHESDRYDV